MPLGVVDHLPLPPHRTRPPRESITTTRTRPVNDMWIAACCLAYEAPLAMLNLKDYEDFTEYHGLPILGAS
jgi:predicted nucleic acid-binding protein